MKTLIKRTLLALIVLPFAALAVEWGALTPAPLPVPNKAGPVHQSKTFIAKVPIKNGEVQLKLPLDTPENSILVIFGKQDITARVKGGALLQKRQYREEMLTAIGMPKMGTRLNISKLSAGEHRLRIETAKRDGFLHYAVAQPESPLALQVQVQPLAVQAGGTVTVTADLSSAPIASAQVQSKIRDVGTITLLDNGLGADVQANDDVFTGQFTAPASQGLKNLRLRVDASGRLSGSTGFKRTGSAGVMVSATSAALGEIHTAPDTLAIDVAGKPGRYRLEVIYGANGQTIAWAQDTVILDDSAANRAATAYLRTGDDKNAPVRQLKRSAPITHATGQFALPRPQIAAAADHAVVRLLNLDTLALEAETLVELTPLTDVVPRFQKRAPGLPDSKAQAARRFGQSGVRQ